MEKFKKFLNLHSLTKSYKNYCINPNYDKPEHKEKYLCFNYCKPLENDLISKDIKFFMVKNHIVIDLFKNF